MAFGFESLGKKVTEIRVSLVLPPWLGQDLLLVGRHSIVGFDDTRGLDASGDPDLFLVVLEVSLLRALTLEVEVEPLEKLASQQQEVGQMTVIERCINDDGDLVVSQLNVSLELVHLRQSCLYVVDDKSFNLEGLSDVLLLLVEIALLLFPYLNFIEDGSDVITRLAHSLLGINNSLQVLDGFLIIQLILRLDEGYEALWLLLWTRFWLGWSWRFHEVVYRWPRECHRSSRLWSNFFGLF